MLKKLIAITAMVTLIPAVPVHASDSRLQAALDAVTAAGMPGAIAAGGNQRAASGFADVETGRPMRPGFSHRMGSITKTFVAVTVLQLVGEGKIRLDAPVADYLPQYDTAGVTVRMLLNHTSGIGDFDDVLFAAPEDLLRHRTTTFTPDQLARAGLDRPRGPQVFAYANTNYVLAGLIIEKVTGRPAILEVSRRVIWPLGLFRTYLAGPASHILGPHSKAYIPWYEGELMDFSVYNMSWGWMLGDLVSTTTDLNTFFRALLTGKLLRPSELTQMMTTVPIDPAHPDAAGYGLGLIKSRFPCGDVWGHDGIVWGHSAVSLHTADGSRQITVGVNMTHYALPSPPHPIDLALGQLLVQELCATSSLRQAFAWRSPVHATNPW
jgi:D-alanyl-D-alanine carboxypeptidase